jgi:hypothetical protein
MTMRLLIAEKNGHTYLFIGEPEADGTVADTFGDGFEIKAEQDVDIDLILPVSLREHFPYDEVLVTE